MQGKIYRPCDTKKLTELLLGNNHSLQGLRLLLGGVSVFYSLGIGVFHHLGYSLKKLCIKRKTEITNLIFALTSTCQRRLHLIYFILVMGHKHNTQQGSIRFVDLFGDLGQIEVFV